MSTLHPGEEKAREVTRKRYEFISNQASGRARGSKIQERPDDPCIKAKQLGKTLFDGEARALKILCECLLHWGSGLLMPYSPHAHPAYPRHRNVAASAAPFGVRRGRTNPGTEEAFPRGSRHPWGTGHPAGKGRQAPGRPAQAAGPLRPQPPAKLQLPACLGAG